MPPFIPARPRRQAEAAGQLPPPSLASLRIEVTASQPKLKCMETKTQPKLYTQPKCVVRLRLLTLRS